MITKNNTPHLEKTLIAFKEYASVVYRMVTAPAGTDIAAAYQRAKESAEKDHVHCMLSSIPEKCLANEGIVKAVPYEPLVLTEVVIGKSDLEANGISKAACRDCSSFEDGSCFRYGGICDPNDFCDHIHGYEIYNLSYGLENFYFRIDEDAAEKYTALEIAEMISKDHDAGSEIRAVMEEDDYEPEEWTLKKEEC